MAVVECPYPCPSEGGCVALLSMFSLIRIAPLVYMLALGFIQGSRSIKAFALVSLGVRTETFNEQLHAWCCVFQVVKLAQMSNRSNKQSLNTAQCFRVINGMGIDNLILQRDNKGYLSYRGTLILKELGNSSVKSFIRTCSSEQDLSENDRINRNLQSSLNREVIFLLPVLLYCSSCACLPAYLFTRIF